MTDQNWFEYLVRVQPHHTDYAGIVWHGTYIAWMEEARVEYLRSHQLDFATWVEAGVDLPVVDLSLRYRQSLRLGEAALVRARPELPKGVRILWHYDIQNQETGETCVLATVTLAPVDSQNRRILRRLPPQFEAFLQSMTPE
ncbi:MAG TPA: thioesterase family protein [Trichocoleus sp.]